MHYAAMAVRLLRSSFHDAARAAVDAAGGRPGDKGALAKTVPQQAMPVLEDGTPCDVRLNPLGVCGWHRVEWDRAHGCGRGGTGRVTNTWRAQLIDGNNINTFQ